MSLKTIRRKGWGKQSKGSVPQGGVSWMPAGPNRKGCVVLNEEQRPQVGWGWGEGRLVLSLEQ